MPRRIFYSLFALAFAFFLGACATQTPPTLSPTSAPPSSAPTAANGAAALACATDNHAPFDAFRPDPVSKLTASTKPKLLEFYAVW